MPPWENYHPTRHLEKGIRPFLGIYRLSHEAQTWAPREVASEQRSPHTPRGPADLTGCSDSPSKERRDHESLLTEKETEAWREVMP